MALKAEEYIKIKKFKFHLQFSSDSNTKTKLKCQKNHQVLIYVNNCAISRVESMACLGEFKINIYEKKKKKEYYVYTV